MIEILNIKNVDQTSQTNYFSGVKMSDYKTDLEIAREAKKERISKVASEKLSIDEDNLVPFGHYKAKLSSEYINKLEEKKDGKLILVTAMTPTTAGEGKTTTSVGLTTV